MVGAWCSPSKAGVTESLTGLYVAKAQILRSNVPLHCIGVEEVQPYTCFHVQEFFIMRMRCATKALPR